jgi:hypothetical protein
MEAEAGRQVKELQRLTYRRITHIYSQHIHVLKNMLNTAEHLIISEYVGIDLSYFFVEC